MHNRFAGLYGNLNIVLLSAANLRSSVQLFGGHSCIVGLLNLLTIFYPDNIQVLTDVFVIKILQDLKSTQDHDGIWSEGQTVRATQARRVRRWKKCRNSYLCLIQRPHSLQVFGMIEVLSFQKSFVSLI